MTGVIPPLAGWKRWRSKFFWEQRAAAYDTWTDRQMLARFPRICSDAWSSNWNSKASIGNRMRLINNRLSAREGGPLVNNMQRAVGRTIIRDRAREYELLNKQLRALRRERYAVTEEFWRRAAKESCGAEIRRVAGSFTIGEAIRDLPRDHGPLGKPR